MQVLALRKDHFITFPNVYIKVTESNDKKSTPTPLKLKIYNYSTSNAEKHLEHAFQRSLIWLLIVTSL